MTITPGFNEEESVEAPSFQAIASSIDDAKPEDEVPIQPSKKQKRDTLILEEQVQEEFERIKGLNFLALAQYKRTLESNISDVKDTMHLIALYESMMKKPESDKSLGTEIAMKNITDQMDLATKEEIQEFKDNYEQNVLNLNRTLEFVMEREEELKDVKKTSTYMNECMLEVIGDKTKPLYEMDHPGTKKLKVFYRNVENVFKDRASMEFLKNQVKPNLVYVKRVVNDINKANKNGKDPTPLTNSIRDNVVSDFLKIFKVEQMRSFENYLKNLFLRGLFPENTNLDVGYILFLYQYLLYIIYKNEKQRHKGNHKWVEALIMNVLDIQTDNYDLQKPVEELNQEIYDMIMEMVRGLPKL